MEKPQMQDADAKSRRGIGTQREGQGGENNAKLNNSSKDQNFDAGFYTKIATTFLLLLASLASKNRVLYSEGRAYQREPSVNYTTFNRQHLCEERCIKNKVGYSNTHGIVSLCYFSR
jgi:hypothetical protein